MSDPAPLPSEVSPLSEYKAVLRQVIDNRPSGTRQRLAAALGKNRSFITQMINPAYSTPVPAQHLETIFHICHFAPTEREAFLDAYRAAHPGRLEIVETDQPMRELLITLPDFGDSALNARADAIILDVARGLASLFSAATPGSDKNNPGESA